MNSRIPAVFSASYPILLDLLTLKLYFLSIYVHFSIGGYVEDSGWFAYLFSGNDPLLHDPRAVDDLSYYAHHVSPIIFLWGSVFSGLLGLSGFASFALFTLVVPVLVILPFVARAYSVRGSASDALAVFACVSLFLLTNELFARAIIYPHFELVIPGLVAVLFYFLQTGRFLMSCLTALLTAITREDGGFFAAYAVLAHGVMSGGARDGVNRPKAAALFVTCVALSALSLLLKAQYFPEFPTFQRNFSGDGFRHVDAVLLKHRLLNMMTDNGTASVILVSLFLSWLNWRFIVPLALMVPLIALQLVSVRDIIGHFTLYYGIPFICVAIVLGQSVAARWAASGNPVYRYATIAFLAVSSVPATYVLRAGNNPTVNWGYYLTRFPAFSVVEASRYVKSLMASGDGSTCGSIGVVALAPDSFSRRQFVKSADFGACDTLILFHGDLHYPRLMPRIVDEGWIAEPAVRAPFEIYRRPPG